MCNWKAQKCVPIGKPSHCVAQQGLQRSVRSSKISEVLWLCARFGSTYTEVLWLWFKGNW